MLALVLEEMHTETVARLIDEWHVDRVPLHAPELAHYEVASALTRERALGELSAGDASEALWVIDNLGIAFHSEPDNVRAIEIGLDLGRHDAYDAAYLALAERLDADVWTVDGPLGRNAGDRYRVMLIE